MKKHILKYMITALLTLYLASVAMAGTADRQKDVWLLDVFESLLDDMTDDVTASEDSYSLELADTLIRMKNRDPFRFAEFDQGYVTFVVDDLLRDLDSIASIFEEFDYPLVLAAIPGRMEKTANGLSEPRGSFFPGMTMKEIMKHVVDNDGEIMAHNESDRLVTKETQYDYEFMYAYFVGTKNMLEEEGFTVRGIMKAGGKGAISGTKEIERWLIGNYDYSNMGTADNYNQTRISIQKSNEEIEQLIREAYEEKKWIKFMVHGYKFGKGQTFRGEEDLRAILSFCRRTGIPVVTYAYIFDNFGSTEYEVSIGGSEQVDGRKTDDRVKMEEY